MDSPIHIIPALFAAMSMLAIKIHSGDKVAQQLAYVKVKLCMIALRELQSSWPVSGWIFLLFAKIVRGIRDEDDKPEQNTSKQPTRTHEVPAEGSWNHEESQNLGPHPGQHPFPEGSVQDPRWAATPMGDGGAEYNTSNSTLGERSVLTNNQFFPMPLDLSTDWSGVRDEDLWLVPGFDFLGDMPRANNLSGFPGV